jgi:hypothetical protein
MSMNRASVLLLSSACVALLIGGCSSTGTEIEDPGDQPGYEYKIRTSPENVLYNLCTSYEFRNADEYLACLADSAVFHLNPADVNNPQNPLPPYWGKDEEETIHRNMFAEESDVESISLTLTTSNIIYLPNLNRWQYSDAVDLRVTVTDVPENTTFHATAPSEFLFQIDPNEVGPHGEQLWEIIHWWDLSAMNRPGNLVSPTTWGKIKTLYR